MISMNPLEFHGSNHFRVRNLNEINPLKNSQVSDIFLFSNAITSKHTKSQQNDHGTITV